MLSLGMMLNLKVEKNVALLQLKTIVMEQWWMLIFVSIPKCWLNLRFN